MSTPAPATMNAKERRKLLRQQQREQEEAAVTEAPVKAEVETKQEPVQQSETQEKTLNAKERRKLLRQQQQREQEDKEQVKEDVKDEGKEEVKAPAGERLNAKQRRLLQRKAARGDEDKDGDEKKKTNEELQIGKKRKRSVKKGDEEGDEEDVKKKRIHLTLFVGQLPFKCTEQMIRKHFAEAGEIQLRMLTDKKTKKFKGTAFIEVKDSKALGAALSRHHTLLNGRRINVELTAAGGGNKSELRRGKIDSLRKKQSEKQIEKTRALVQKHIDDPASKLSGEDVDERMIDFLSWFDYETAKKALDEFNKSMSDRVKNSKAFFMGILKRFRETDGVE